MKVYLVESIHELGVEAEAVFESLEKAKSYIENAASSPLRMTNWYLTPIGVDVNQNT